MSTRFTIVGLPALAAALLISGVAAAQPAGAGATPQGTIPSSGDGSGDLSHRLSRSSGVIKPPADVDPKMQAPVPDPHPGTTPVIPPPGSPGGNPDIHPK